MMDRLAALSTTLRTEPMLPATEIRGAWRLKEWDVLLAQEFAPALTPTTLHVPPKIKFVDMISSVAVDNVLTPHSQLAKEVHGGSPRH